MEIIKLFEDYFSEREENKKRIDDATGIIVDIDGEKITWEDIKGIYRKSIESFYGDFYDVEKALDHLYNIDGYWNHGGDIFRVVWLDDIEEFKKDELGYHWVSDPYDCESIIFSLAPNDQQIFKKDENGKHIYNSLGLWEVERIIKNTKEPYIIHAYTPPHNVRIPDDYFNNLNELEVFIKDQKKLIFRNIEKS